MQSLFSRLRLKRVGQKFTCFRKSLSWTPFTRGFYHIVKLLDINSDTIKQEIAIQQAQKAEEEKAKMKEEIKKELQRESLKKEVLNEIETSKKV